MTKDTILLRAKDIVLISVVLGLLGMIYGPLRKSVKWDESVEQVQELKKKVDAQTLDMAVIKTQYTAIEKHLEEISLRLQRINQ